MSHLLSASGLSFSYTDRPVLRDVSLTLDPGEVVALLGPNGSGKTTLIRSLLGHLRAQGSIEWAGRSLDSWARRDLARRVAYLPQSPTYESGQTVLDVLRLGRAPYWKTFGIESEHDAEVVSRITDLLDLRDLLTRDMDRLSGGQRRRIFLGRCLVQEPAAMLLDEPNTFLDLKSQIDLLKLLTQLSAEERIGILMASHDVNLAAAMADRIVLLKQGSVAKEGVAHLVLEPTLLSDVYGVLMDRFDPPGGGGPLIRPSALGKPKNG